MDKMSGFLTAVRCSYRGTTDYMQSIAYYPDEAVHHLCV